MLPVSHVRSRELGLVLASVSSLVRHKELLASVTSVSFSFLRQPFRTAADATPSTSQTNVPDESTFTMQLRCISVPTSPTLNGHGSQHAQVQQQQCMGPITVFHPAVDKELHGILDGDSNHGSQSTTMAAKELGFSPGDEAWEALNRMPQQLAARPGSLFSSLIKQIASYPTPAPTSVPVRAEVTAQDQAHLSEWQEECLRLHGKRGQDLENMIKFEGVGQDSSLVNRSVTT